MRGLAREGGEVHLLGLLLLQEHRARIARPGLLPGHQHADQHGYGLHTIMKLTQMLVRTAIAHFCKAHTLLGKPAIAHTCKAEHLPGKTAAALSKVSVTEYTVTNTS